MRIRITGDGRVLEGTAKQIVEAMHYVAFGQERRVHRLGRGSSHTDERDRPEGRWRDRW
jgi:hypothetical protein